MASKSSAPMPNQYFSAAIPQTPNLVSTAAFVASALPKEPASPHAHAHNCAQAHAGASITTAGHGAPTLSPSPATMAANPPKNTKPPKHRPAAASSSSSLASPTAASGAVSGTGAGAGSAPVEDVLRYFNATEMTAPEGRLDKYLHGVTQHFLTEQRVCNAAPGEQALKERFSNPSVPSDPSDLSGYFLRFVQQAVMETTHCHSPAMIGHMTSALPFFHRPLAQLVTAMNQNTVKIETSSMTTFLERETLAKMHRAFFAREEAFYQRTIHNPDACLGCVTSGGTLANLTALWVARNKALGPRGEFAGVEQEGLHRALRHYGYEDAVVLGSQMMHYSMKKATDLLGIGTSGLVTIPYDERYRVRIDAMEQALLDCQRKRILVLAIVGVAGATEAGSIDDLQALSALARRFKVHLHVDAAWGGPLVFSRTHRPKLAGIELADSVTVDGHKQLYTPMGCGVVVFADPSDAKAIRKTANYIIRKESLDVGKFSPEGSRPASAIYLHACLSLLGVRGYEALIDRSCSLVAYMAAKIRASDDFELVVEPMSNILLYRWIPEGLRDRRRAGTLTREDNELINQRNVELQNLVCKDAESFVSRTTVHSPKYGMMGIVGLRVVIANPNTKNEHIDLALREQRSLVRKLSQ